jgi:hypothetical protein
VTVAVVVIEAGECLLYTPFLAAFVADLKDTIPSRYRFWDRPGRCWRVADPYVNTAIDVTRVHFPRIQVDDRRRPRVPPPSVPAVSWPKALHDALPERLRVPVFRALACILHPDANGDLRAMQELNDGWPR